MVESSSYELVHRRLAHVNEKSIDFLTRSGYVQCSNPVEKVCETYMMGNRSSLPYHSRETVSKNPLDLIISNVCCVESPGLNGEKYFVTFLDDCTNFCIVFPVISKFDVFVKFKEFVALAENQFDRKIQCFRSENGTEYLTTEFLEFCRERRIHVQKTVPCNSQSLNLLLAEKARCLLQESGLGKEFWNEAVQCAVYALNRCPIRENTIILAERWYGEKVEYSKLRTFGCVAYLRISEQRCKENPCIFVGYAPQGYRLWDLENEKIVIGRNVRFDESELFKDIVVNLTRVTVSSKTRKNTDVVTPQLEPVVTEKGSSPSTSTSTKGSSPSTNGSSPIFETRKSDRTRKQPLHLQDFDLNLCEALLCQSAAKFCGKKTNFRQFKPPFKLVRTNV